MILWIESYGVTVQTDLLQQYFQNALFLSQYFTK